MAAGLASSGLGLTSGGLRTFSLGSGSGNGAGISSSFSTSRADSGSSSLDTENLSEGGIRSGVQQLSPNVQLVSNFVPRLQNDGFSINSNGQRFVSFGGGRTDGFGGLTANAVPQGSWVVDVSSFGDSTSAPNTFQVNRSPEQSSPSFTQPSWSAHQQATVRSPINPNYLQEYIVPQRSASSIYYTVPEAQSPNLSPRSLGYVARGGDGLQLQYSRGGGGVYGGGPITGQGYLAGGQLIPAQQFQLAF
ncbi:hypothetical protein LSTR_LSTR016120 [Laodelphax striatellus]|uniref:Uncharacterized protein n=1 Tax=Laodelphax striatellus TaxID=195883 RepID=A0A482WZL2_LAOST|nr:hypothetical protein LSTR_LSTR016120 [Laodelphax striatellus]